MENFVLNHTLVNTFYIGVHPATWQLILGTVAAKYVLYIFPLFLVYQFIMHKERRALVLVTVITLIAILGLNTLFDHFLMVNRPFVDGLVQNQLPHAATNSFPSTHAAITSAVAFCFLYQKLRRIGYVLLALALFVSWGRVCMGLHYPLDIVGGFAISAVMSFVCMKLFYRPLNSLRIFSQ